ncbi:hypothetical protein B0A48_15822 [Cryoendolithus antarcticus]|uniref:Uncharacterized protein n=1 Tax=Cryoendolithus antarcticus TaxID=1507870 RepID=A0A1V8SHW4_9PEZI|nr:hypothetical protein B0A48_15822 [Cryoendolithus antarcticus]
MRASLLAGLLPLAAARALPQGPSPTSSPSSSISTTSPSGPAPTGPPSSSPAGPASTITSTGSVPTTFAVVVATSTPTPTKPGTTAYIMVGPPSNGASTLSPFWTYPNPMSSAAIASASLLPDPIAGTQHCGKGSVDIKDTKGKADHFQLVVMQRRTNAGEVDLSRVQAESMPIVLTRTQNRKNNALRPDKHVWLPTFHPGAKVGNESSAYFNLRSGQLETDDKLSSNHKFLHFSLDADPKLNKKASQTYEPLLTTDPFDPIGALKKSNLHAKKNWLLTRNNYTLNGQSNGPNYYSLLNSKTKGEFAACAREKSHWIEPVKMVDLAVADAPAPVPGPADKGPEDKDFNLMKAFDKKDLDITLHYGNIEALKSKAGASEVAFQWCTPVDIYATWDRTLNVHSS